MCWSRLEIGTNIESCQRMENAWEDWVRKNKTLIMNGVLINNLFGLIGVITAVGSLYYSRKRYWLESTEVKNHEIEHSEPKTVRIKPSKPIIYIRKVLVYEMKCKRVLNTM